MKDRQLISHSPVHSGFLSYRDVIRSIDHATGPPMRQAMIKLRIALCLLIFVPAIANALNPEDIKPGQVYSSTGMINLRDAPPKTLFYIMGDKTGLVDKNSRVTVKSVKIIKTLTGTHYWLEVETKQPGTGATENGWVYGGEAGTKSLFEVAQ